MVLYVFSKNVLKNSFKKQEPKVSYFFLSNHLPHFIYFFVGGAVMSFDGNEDVMLRNLEQGIEFYIRKPVLMENMIEISQYVYTRRQRSLVAPQPWMNPIIK